MKGRWRLSASGPGRTRALMAVALLCSAAAVARAPESPGEDPLTLVHRGLPHDALYDLTFRGERGLAVGAHGMVLASGDGGRSWQQLPAPTALALTAVACSAARCILVGQQGAIFTGPVGGPFAAVESPTSERLLSVALDEASGRAVIVGGFGTLLLSEDHGASWQPVFLDWIEFNQDGLEAHLYDAAISASGRLLLAGEFGLVLSSDDSGSSWTARNQGDASLFALHLSGDGRRGFAVGQNGVALRSDDGGDSWSALATDTGGNLLDVWASPEDEVVIVGIRELLRSSDGGASFRRSEDAAIRRSWYQALASGIVRKGGAGVNIAAQTVYAVGAMGSIARVNH